MERRVIMYFFLLVCLPAFAGNKIRNGTLILAPRKKIEKKNKNQR
uniref:Uncharacterized protein n=1 Tax=Rhizophora mucronata TaxID=61149 RepID=A0A2P2JQU3_RHIMU